MNMFQKVCKYRRQEVGESKLTEVETVNKVYFTEVKNLACRVLDHETKRYSSWDKQLIKKNLQSTYLVDKIKQERDLIYIRNT